MGLLLASLAATAVEGPSGGFAGVAATVCFPDAVNGTLSASSFWQALTFSFLAVISMALYPQLMFKSQKRTLEIKRDGISTTVGRRSGKSSWRDIQAVSQKGTGIVILGRNGNAFVVPLRAFSSHADRDRFFSYARNAVMACWQRAPGVERGEEKLPRG